MKGNPEDRAVRIGIYISETGATVRTAATEFGVSKSTVHKDMTQRLVRVNQNLYEKVRIVLDENKDQRHLRGGMATRLKYHPEESEAILQ